MTSFTNWGAFIAMLVLLDKITKNGFQLGNLWAVSGLLPLIFGLVVGGVWIDRVSSKRVLISFEFILAFLYLIFLLIIPLSQKSLAEAWILFLLLRFVIGVLGNLQGTAYQTIIPHIIEKDDLAVANSISFSITSLVRLSGATLGGALLALFSLNILWIINAFSLFISGILLIYGLRKVSPDVKSKSVKRSFLKEARDGLQIAKNNPLILGVLTASIFTGTIIGSYNLMLQQFSYNIYHTSSSGLSTLYVSEGLVSFLVSFIIANKNMKLANPKRIWIAYLFLGFGWFMFSFTHNLLYGILALFIFALSSPFSSNYERYVMQINTPGEFRGRIFGFWGSLYSMSIQIGAFVTGVIINNLSLNMVPMILGGLEMLFAIAFGIYFLTSRQKFNLIHRQQRLG
jgi:predicted MFS family arabinose efflux permease